ncbi:MAG: DUF1592 domain-containing protein [Fimbriimonadaceae bacterium]|nr:DUF1592 domain-containing protein [Fimbriimonadaceae bacterium]
MKSKRVRGHVEIGKIAGILLTSSFLAGVVTLGPGLSPQSAKAKQGQAKPASAKKPAAKATASGDAYTRTIQPFVTKYCGGCHGGTTQVANISLTKDKSLAAAAKNAGLWQRAAANVSNSHMPPKGLPAPTLKERQAFVDAVKSLTIADCSLADAGKVTVRRLNRAEYNATVRDLVGVDFRPADDFPSDDVGYGFDNIGDVLTISPLLMEKYLNAAEAIAAQAIQLPIPSKFTLTGPMLSKAGSASQDDDSVDLMSGDGKAIGEFNIKRPGRYVVRFAGYQYAAGPENASVALRLNGEEVGRFEMANIAPKTATFELPARLNKGKNRVEVQFLNDFYDPKGPDGRKDRNVTIRSIEVVRTDPESYSESHRRLIPVDPKPGTERDTAKAVLTKFAERAYRRPVSADEVNRLMSLYDLSTKAKEPFERGVQLGITAALVSPHFLFRVEVDPRDAKGSRELTDFELATRLSYFIWSSCPDDRLFELARQKKLRQPGVLKAEVVRMLADPRAEGLADNFAEQWFQLRRLDGFNPNPKQFPGFDNELKEDLRTETKRFFMHVLRRNESALDFIDGKYTFLNERLAKHYGVPSISGDQFRLVAMNSPQRGGVLGHASILSITSNPTRTSPVKRGKWVLENILGTPPPPPPPGVPDLEEKHEDMTAKTLRERMELHRKKPDCFSCHSRMDPIGFGMENYDAVGKWRTADDGATLDTSGVLPDGRKFKGPQQLKQILLQNKEQFVRTLTDRLLTYSMGRGMEPKDQCHIDSIVARAKANEYRFADMIVAVVQSDPFRKRDIRP